jgi:hypothetical protein
MKLTLHIEWLKDVGPGYETAKKKSITVQLPNSDFFYAFEAWMNISSLSKGNEAEGRCLDQMIDTCYNIVIDVCEEVLGLSEKMYKEGIFDIDDPVAETLDKGVVYITIYV